MSSGHMRLQPVIATRILPLEAPEKAAIIDTERLCTNFVYANGRVQAAVSTIVDRGSGDMPRSDVDVLVALDPYNPDLVRKHANTQVCSSGNLNLYFEVIVVLEVGSLDR